MDDFITQTEILKLMGINTTNTTSSFNNLRNRGKLEGFPKPLKQQYRRQAVYSKARVIAWLNGDNQNLANLAFEFLTGKYAPKTLKSKWKMRKMIARLNKPETVTVRCVGDW